MAAERGLTFTAAKTGEYVSGTLVGSTQLASGRFAMIDDGIGFQLVPWQPGLDKRVGQGTFRRRAVSDGLRRPATANDAGIPIIHGFI
jgi:Protein of unknown function (DUF3363)